MRQKHKFTAFLLSLCLMLGVVAPGSSTTTYAADGTIVGSGAQDNPYRIADATDLITFAALVNNGDSDACAVLINNLDMSGENWTGISTDTVVYTGTFDGQGFTIDNLTGSEGLFKKNAGTVKNVRLTNANIQRDGGNLGAIAGENIGGTISGCVTSGSISGNSYSIGGLVSWNSSGGTIVGCISSCQVSGKTAGGLVGSNYDENRNYGVLTGCAYTGEMTGKQIEADNTYAEKTDVFYLDTEKTWHRSDTGSSVIVEASEAVSIVNEYLRKIGNYYFILCNDGSVILAQLLGSGTKEDPYSIYTAGQLKEFAEKVNNGEVTACAIMMKDITLNYGDISGWNGIEDNSWEQWTPIGSSTPGYQGTFDGQGYTINGLYINSSNIDSNFYQGLFSTISENGIVKNVGIVNSNIQGGRYTGSIAGDNNGTVENCYHTGRITGDEYVGGIIGVNENTVRNCYNVGTVSGPTAGGIVGWTRASDDSVSSQFAYCFNTGIVTGQDFVGSIAGEVTGTKTIQSCYYLIGTAKQGVGNGDDTAVTALTTEQMTGFNAERYMRDLFEYPNYRVWKSGTAYWSYLGQSQDDATEGIYRFYGELPRLSNTVTEEHITLQTEDRKGMPQQTEDGKTYYLIYTAEQLKTFCDMVNGSLSNEYSFYSEDFNSNGRLMADIDLNPGFIFYSDGTYTGEGTPEQWTPIGSSNNYGGTFDGNGHIVRGVYIDNDDYAMLVGLFSSVSESGTVKNLGIENSYLSPNVGTYLGSLAGENFGVIETCYSSAHISFQEHLGGLVGYNSGTIRNCYFAGTVYSNFQAAGITGYNGYGGSIERCYSTGISFGDPNSNLFAGITLFNRGSVANCYYLEGAAQTGINAGTIEGAASFTVEEAEKSGAGGLLAGLIEGSGEGVWNNMLSAVGTWETGKPAVQPVLSWQTAIENSPSYTVTIPEQAAMGDTVSISVSADALKSTQTVEVRTVQDAVLELSYSSEPGSDSITYEMFVDNSDTALPAGGLLIESGNAPSDQPAKSTLRFVLTGTPKYAGSYTGTLVFQISVKEEKGE